MCVWKPATVTVQGEDAQASLLNASVVSPKAWLPQPGQVHRFCSQIVRVLLRCSDY